MGYDFQCELKLKKEDPHLSELVKNTSVVMSNLLDKYTTYFPDFTDHSVLHSMQVIDFCNRLIGDQIDRLNADEIYILLMSCYMHDTGMGISDADYKKFHDKVVSKEFQEKNPNISIRDSIRTFHHEFSASIIRKYAMLFEIPDETYINAIVQVSKGHRKTDLYSETEYPTDYKLSNGNTVCLPYLAALIRLADELDIASDRNIFKEAEIYATRDMIKHFSIKSMEMKEDHFVLTIIKLTDDEKVLAYINEEVEKLKKTLDYCIDVVEKRTKFEIKQKRIEIVEI